MKKLTVAAIITVMAASVFTGCGSAGRVQSGDGAGTSSAGQTDYTDGTADTGTQDIGEEKALQTALETAGISEADASRVRVSADRDDGRVVYDVRFDVDGTEYDYEILASDGQVVSADIEQRRDIRYDEDTNTDDRKNGNSDDVAVSSEKAIETALAKVPGATENDIRIELDYDDGRYKYEGDIIYNRVEYDFEIDANSGEILEWSEERD